MSVIATESDTETDQTDAPDAPTTVELDVNVVFEQAGSLIDLSHPGTTLSPLEPSTTEPSRDAVMLVGIGDLSSIILLVDGASESESFDAVEVMAALSERLTETMSLELHTLEEATEIQVRSLAEATRFRTSLTAPETPMGELRFAVATIASDDGTEESAEDESSGDDDSLNEGDTVVPTKASATGDALATPDAAALAERLPNLAAVDMSVSVELGRVKLPIRELLGLGSGSVIRLGTPVGESFDILVNGKAAARGDLVVVGGRLAVRIRELLGVDA